MHFTFSPENYATFARSLTVISLCDLFWYDLLSLPKVTGYNLYRTAPNKLRVGCVRLWFNVSRLCSTYIRVCVISANLAQNRVRLIHEVDLYTEIYGIQLMKWILIYLLCGQEVWSEPSIGARMVPANGQTTKTKKILYYVVLVGKTFHLITNIYIRVQFLFSKRGACFYWVPCFYWDIPYST